MTTTVYTLTVPWVPPSLNVWNRMHWAKRYKLKQQLQYEIQMELRRKGNVCPKFQKVELRAVLMFMLDRRRDSDNFGAVLWKIVQDALVAGGVIPDDDAEHCTSYPPAIVLGDHDQTFVIVKGEVG